MPRGMVTKRKTTQTARASDTPKESALPDEKDTALRALCEKYFWREMEQLEKLFETQHSTFSNLNDLKSFTFVTNAKKTSIDLLKKIAIASKKPVKKVEKEIATISSIIASARKRVGDKGFTEGDENGTSH